MNSLLFSKPRERNGLEVLLLAQCNSPAIEFAAQMKPYAAYSERCYALVAKHDDSDTPVTVVAVGLLLCREISEAISRVFGVLG
jgi:hypothetical protein